jgi:hypothetical protein
MLQTNLLVFIIFLTIVTKYLPDLSMTNFHRWNWLTSISLKHCLRGLRHFESSFYLYQFIVKFHFSKTSNFQQNLLDKVRFLPNAFFKPEKKLIINEQKTKGLMQFWYFFSRIVGEAAFTNKHSWLHSVSCEVYSFQYHSFIFLLFLLLIY